MDQQAPKETLSFDADDEVDQPTIASASTSRKDSQKSSASKDRFTKEDFDRVLSWLEHEPNFVLIHGTSGQTSVGKPTRTAASGYSTLATLVSRHSKGRLNLTGRAMRERFQRHKTKYKSVKELSSHTGFGVTDEDRKNGIYTLAGKLESLCTCYQRMDAMYGRKPNVKPLVEMSMAKHDTIRELSSEDGEDQDIGGLDHTFIDNDNVNDNYNDNYNDNDNDNYNDNDNDNGNYNYDDDNDNDNNDNDNDNNDNDNVGDNNGDNNDNVERVDDNDGPGLEGPVLDPAVAFDLELDAIFGPVVTDHPDVVEVPAASNPASRQQVGKSRPLKRRASESDSNVSRKSRATDTRKAPPKLNQTPSQTGRNGFATAYMDSSASKLEVLREMEEKKLEYDKENHTSRIELDRKRVELEQQRITLEREQTERRLEAEKEQTERKLEAEKEQTERKLEAEKEQAERKLEAERQLLTLRLKSEAELEERKLLWEKERMEADRDTKYMMQRAMVVQSAMSNGFKLDDIKELMAIVRDK